MALYWLFKFNMDISLVNRKNISSIYRKMSLLEIFTRINNTILKYNS